MTSPDSGSEIALALLQIGHIKLEEDDDAVVNLVLLFIVYCSCDTHKKVRICHIN